MGFTDWVGSLFASKGSDRDAVTGTFNTAQAATLANMTTQANGRVIYGRGAQNLSLSQAYAAHQSGQDTADTSLGLGSLFRSSPVQAVTGVLNYVPTKADQGLTALDLHLGGLSWSQAWAAHTNEGVMIDGQQLHNVNIGQLSYQAIRHPTFLGGRKPITTAEGAQQFQQQTQDTWAGKLFGGALGTMITWFADPTIGIGKAAKITRVAGRAADAADAEKTADATLGIIKGDTKAQSRYSPARLNPFSETGLFSKGYEESGQREFRAIVTTDNKTIADSPEIQKMVERVPDSAPIFALFDRASEIKDIDLQREAKANIFGAARGSQKSGDWLAANQPLLARAQQRMSEVPEGRPQLDAMHEAYAATATKAYEQPTFDQLADSENIALSEADQARKRAAQSMQDAIDAQRTPANLAEMEAVNPDLLNVHAHLEALEQIGQDTPLEKVGTTALDRVKAGMQGGIARSYYFQNGAGGATYRVMHWATSQRFRGHIDTADVQRGNAELMDHMKRTRLFEGDELRDMSNQYLTTTSVTGRNNVLDKVKAAMYAKIGDKYDLTPQQVSELVAQDAEVSGMGRRYTTAELQAAREEGRDNVVLLSPTGDNHISVKTALLETHVQGRMFMPDRREIENIVKAEKGIGTSLPGTMADAAAHFNNRLNSMTNIWRLAVLGRPGLLVRTQIDTQGRALATMGGSAYMFQAATALGHEIGRRLPIEQVMKTTALARDMAHADDLDDVADQLQHFLDRHTDPLLDDVPLPPTLEARGKALMGEDQGTFEADNWRYATPEALAERIRLLRDGAEDARNTERFAYRFKLGMQNQTMRFGEGTATTRAYEDTQNFDDIAKGGTLYPGRVTRQEALTHSVETGKAGEVEQQGAIGAAFSALAGNRASKLYADSKNYVTAAPDRDQWAHFYVRGTDPIRNSDTGKRILRLADVGTPDMMRALRDDAAVRANYREMHLTGETLDDWIARASDEVIGLAPTKEIRKALLTKGHMTQKDAEDLFAPMTKDDKGAYVKVDPNDARPPRPHVHGPHLSSMANLPRSQRTDGILKKIITNFGDKPDLMWGRHPVYVNRYYTHFNELARREFARNKGMTAMPAATQAKIEAVARHRAIMDTQQVMYNTAKYTGAHASLRWISPFAGAWQDALESWSRLFYDDPAVAGAFAKLWAAPNRAGLVIDQDGNPVAPGGHAQQQFILFPGEWSNDFANSARVQVRKASFNTMFQGAQWYTPGTGPLVQIPVQEVVARTVPELGNSTNPLVKIFLPFGTPKTGSQGKGLGEDILAGLAPSYVRDLYGAFWGADNAAAFQTAYNAEVIKARQSERPPQSDKDWQKIYDRANKAARNAGFIKALSIGVLGFSGSGSNIADYYRKQYNLYVSGQKQLPDGKSPTEAFVAEFPEAAGLNFGFRKSQTGINATIEGMDAAKQYAPYINKQPEYGWFYAGAANIGGQFSQTAYNYQASHMIGDKPERFTRSKGELALLTQAEDGWSQYNSFMTGVNLKLKLWGLKSLRENGAGELADIKAKYVADLEKANPAWGKEYLGGGVDHKLETFIQYAAEPAINDPKLSSRSDITALAAYLDFRKQALARAEQWGYKSLSSEHTQPLAAAVAQYGRDLAASDPGFEQIWNRVLSSEVDDAIQEPAQ